MILFLFFSYTLAEVKSSIDVNGIVRYYGDGVITPDIVTNSGTQSEIKGVEIDGPNEIADGAFTGYGAMQYIVIPNSLTIFCSSAFFRNTNLAEFRIEDDHPTLYRDKQGGVLSKNLSILYQVPKTIKSFRIPESVQTICARCFSSTILEELFFPASVTTLLGVVMNEASGNCVVTFAEDSNLKNIPYGSFWFRSAAHFHIPSSVEEISNEAFLSSGTKIFEFDDISNSKLTTLGTQAFSGFAGTSITLPPRIKELPQSVFKDSKLLTTINIPRDCEFIHPDAFVGCSALSLVTVDSGNKNYTNIDGCVYSTDLKTICILPLGIENLTISSELKEIGTGTIQSCKNLTSLTVLPGSDTFFADKGVLYNAAKTELIAVAGGITSVHINNTVKQINQVSFSGVDVINVTFEEGSTLTYIHSSAFESCTKIQYMELPDSVKEIYSYAFEKCSIEYLKIGENSKLEKIYTHAFGSSNLRSFFIGPRLSIIYTSAFYNTKLTTLEFANTLVLEEIHTSAFASAQLSCVFKIPTTLRVIGQTAFNSQSKMKIEFIGKSNIVSVGMSAFSGCSSITEFVFGDDVELIDINAFRSTGIKTLTIQSTKMTAIKSGAFSNCVSLISIDLPVSLREASPTIFEGCVSLQTINAHSQSEFLSTDNGVLYSLNKDKVFICPPGKESVVLHMDTVQFESRAFFECTKLTTVDFLSASKLRAISEYTFMGCTGLVEIKLPRSVVNLSGSCFNGCIKLGSVMFMDESELQEIEESTFEGCVELSRIDFGENSKLLRIGAKAFKGCSQLQSIEVPASCQMVGEESFASTGLLRISIQNTSIEVIPAKLFNDCKGLHTVALPTTLTQIGAGFLSGTIVHNVTLNTVTGISVGAFNGANNLRLIRLCGNIQLGVEGAIPSSVTVYVTGNYEGLKYCGLPVVKGLKDDCEFIPPASFMFTSANEFGFCLALMEAGILSE